MNALDRRLQAWRIAKVRPFIPAASSVLDIGTADGALFARLGDRVARGVGIDPDAPDTSDGRVRLIRGRFPDDLADGETFDVVTALAFFEHVPEDEQSAVAAACFRVVEPGGRCILTVPSAAVDRILDVLVRIRVLDGMHEGEHHGFDAGQTSPIFCDAGFVPHVWRRFQLGLNNLFVFTKPRSGS